MSELDIMLLFGAVPAAIVALIMRFAISMNVMPPGPEDAPEVVELKATIKAQKRVSAILAVISALLFLAFALI